MTNPERIPRWFLPVTGELEPGGRYQVEGNAGGTVERCDEPSSFAVTWEFGGTVSWLEIRLTSDGGHTSLELLHEAHVDPEFWARFGPGAVGVGWDLALVALGLHVETGEPVDPAEGQAFATNPRGVQFVRHAATGWASAAAADGDEAGPAHEAAARTVAFYTGTEAGAEPGAEPGTEPEA